MGKKGEEDRTLIFFILPDIRIAVLASNAVVLKFFFFLNKGTIEGGFELENLRQTKAKQRGIRGFFRARTKAKQPLQKQLSGTQTKNEKNLKHTQDFASIMDTYTAKPHCIRRMNAHT